MSKFSTSENVILNIVNSAVSSISYCRGLFPSDHFGSLKLRNGKSSQQGGISSSRIVVFKKAGEKPKELQKFLHWIDDGVKHLVKRQYLKGFVLFVCGDFACPMKSLLESYEFSFNYCLKGSLRKEEISREEVIGIMVKFSKIMKLLSIKKLKDLPKKRVISMIYANRQVAPLRYDFAEYVRYVGDKTKVTYEKGINKLKLIEFSTPFHRIAIHMRYNKELIKG